MKTKFILLLFVFTHCKSMYAQTEKVGININNPTRSLDISGDIRIRVIKDTITNNLKYLIVDDSGNVYKSLVSVTNSNIDTCPSGFVSVNDEYCIEKNERTATTWWNAIEICGSLNAHLCKWDEWYFAANKGAALGLTNLTGAWEWIADGGGGVTMKIVGLNIITESATTNNAVSPYEFRCCKSK